MLSRVIAKNVGDVFLRHSVGHVHVVKVDKFHYKHQNSAVRTECLHISAVLLLQR